MPEIYTANSYLFEENEINNLHIENSADEIYSLVQNGFSKIIIKSLKNTEKTAIASSFIERLSDKYDDIFYIEYDKEKRIFSNAFRESPDSVLKDCILRVFLKHDFEKYSLSDYNANINFLSKFEEKIASKKTLVIIDYFEISAPTPYLRHLLSSKCALILMSQKLCDKNAKTVYLSDKNSFPCCEKAILSLSENQKRLLFSLCAMLNFRNYDTDGENKRIFNRKSVKNYLGNLAKELDSLIDCGIIVEISDKNLKINKIFSEYVLSNFKITCEDCKEFMSFLEKHADFTIYQDIKDLKGEIVIAKQEKNNISSVISNGELLQLYTHFAPNDKNRALRLYNMLFCTVFKANPQSKRSDILSTLFIKNRSYYLELLYNSYDESVGKVIYSDENYQSTYAPKCYSEDILFRLDIMKLCMCFLYGLGTDWYKSNENVLQILLECLEYIYEKSNASNISNLEKMYLTDSCIRICFETFSHNIPITQDGTYSPWRDKEDLTFVNYSCMYYSDRKSSGGLALGYNEKTLRLYFSFIKHLEKWLNLSRCTDLSLDDEIEKSIHEQKELVYKRTYDELSATLLRFFNGFDKFYDFYSESALKEAKCIDIKSDNCGIISKNSRLAKRGFDSGTKSGAEKYANMIITTIAQSENPFSLIKLIFSRDYLISDFCYGCLRQNSFSKLVAENEKMPNLTKQNLLLQLIDTYFESEKREQKTLLWQETILDLAKSIKFSSSFKEKLYRCTSSMYFEKKTHEYKSGAQSSFSSKLYYDFCASTQLIPHCSDEFIADSIFRRERGLRQRGSKQKLIQAFKCAVLEYLYDENDFDSDGFIRIAYLLTGDKGKAEIESVFPHS